MSQRWPGQCCVPAFIGRALAELAGHNDLVDDERYRRAMAITTGVTVPPDDPNPWGLPTSSESGDWGVSPAQARATFPSALALVGEGLDLRFDIVKISTVPFGLYEDQARDLAEEGAVVGVAFDFAELDGDQKRSEPHRDAHHVARLTPIGAEQDLQPNVLSPDFRFEYDGEVWLFDDSGELARDESCVYWRRLMRACHRVDGGFWAVRRG